VPPYGYDFTQTVFWQKSFTRGKFGERKKELNITKLNWTDQHSRFVSLREMSKIFNVSYQTLNYYTNLGLIKPHKRQGNKRLYLTEEVIERLQKITKLKNEGYPLQVISNILNNGRDVKNELF